METIFGMNITWLTFCQSPLSLAFMLFMFSPLVNRQNVSPHFFCFTSFPLLSGLRNTPFLLPFFLQKQQQQQQLLWHNTVTLQWAVSIFSFLFCFPFFLCQTFDRQSEDRPLLWGKKSWTERDFAEVQEETEEEKKVKKKVKKRTLTDNARQKGDGKLKGKNVGQCRQQSGSSLWCEL